MKTNRVMIYWVL